jgi:hypothetical protein
VFFGTGQVQLLGAALGYVMDSMTATSSSPHFKIADSSAQEERSLLLNAGFEAKQYICRPDPQRGHYACTMF